MTALNITVLGGSGFVGGHLVPALARLGHRVTVISRQPRVPRELAIDAGIRCICADPYDVDALAERLRDQQVLINLVGILNERGRDGSGFRRAHVELTRGAIAACRRAGVPRLLQMSALNAGRKRSHYLRTRGEAEALVRESGLDWTLFQPSVIFGRGDGLFQRFASLLRLTPVLPLARADARFAPVYVGDVVAAFVRALDDPGTIGRCYELYGPDVLTLRQIVEYTAQQMGVHRLVLPLPDSLGRLQAALMDHVPGKPFSTDNFRSLQIDSVGGVDGLFMLGIAKTPIGAVVPQLFGRAGRQARLSRLRASR